MRSWVKRKPMSLSGRWMLLLLAMTLLSSCAWIKGSPEPRFCPVKNLLAEDGSVDQQYWAVERECLRSLQKRLDAAYGE